MADRYPYTPHLSPEKKWDFEGWKKHYAHVYTADEPIQWDGPRMDARIFDVDGTLASTEWRDPLVRGDKKDWKNYHAGMSRDAGIDSTIRAARRAHARGEKVVLLTLRPERYRPVIEKWMKQHGVPFDELYLRPEGDFRRGREVKRAIYKNKIRPKYDVKMAYDDFHEILSMWDEEGVPNTKVIDPGKPPLPIKPAPDPRTLPPSQGPKGGRVWVTPYIGERGGKPEYISGYWREFSAKSSVDELAVKLSRE